MGFLKNKLLLILILFILFIFKIYLNSFLKAENGDTYDFFQVAYQLQNGNFFYESKRQPLFPLFLAFFNSSDFVFFGRLINNLFYFLSIIFFYKLISIKFSLKDSEKILFSLVFALNFIIFDNSFFILSDSLLLCLSVLFFLLYEKKVPSYWLVFVSVLAFYTRFEGILLFGVLITLYLLQKNYKLFTINLIIFLILSLPLLFKFYINAQIGSSYLSDEVGFTLTLENITKALGSVVFATGGFWLFSIFILDSKISEIFKNPKRFIINKLKNPYVALFLAYSFILILWGFFIRLYSVIVFLSILYFIHFYTTNSKISKKYYLLIVPFLFYILNIQILDHFDLGYLKFSKIVSGIFSVLIIFLVIFKDARKNFKYILILIISLNIVIFTEKFLVTREKYFTLVLASEYVVNNKLQNVAYFDESGVQQWYLKDFSGNFQYFNETGPLDAWLKENKINYMMITDEMGFQILKINDYRDYIKQLDVVKEFKSDFFGGRTTIYELKNHSIIP